jgi:hypothetical protein
MAEARRLDPPVTAPPGPERHRRAARLKDSATDEGDRRRLARYAEELEESASRLERTAVEAGMG